MQYNSIQQTFLDCLAHSLPSARKVFTRRIWANLDALSL